MTVIVPALLIVLQCVSCGLVQESPSAQQLEKWLKRFPDADANRDGRLTAAEAANYRRRLRDSSRQPRRSGRGVPREFRVDPGWNASRFPEHAVCYQTPTEIAAIYAKARGGQGSPVVSYAKPGDGALRIVGTGHSFMGPGYRTFPRIVRAAGFQQPPLLTHTGGGITGSARYKWEQENGIFGFDGRPTPKLLASIANAQWDVMMWGPYYQDRPVYYSCWIDFCLKYNPEMKFYLSDAWPQLDQLETLPTSEDELTEELFLQLGMEKNATYGSLVRKLNEEYSGKVFVLPTNDAMVLAVKAYHRGELPGVSGIHASVGGKERSLWRDRLGHLGPGFDRLEGYVFYATIYGRSPELIDGEIDFGGDAEYPSPELDRVFRRLAWQAAAHNPLSGVTDRNRDGVSDNRQ